MLQRERIFHCRGKMWVERKTSCRHENNSLSLCSRLWFLPRRFSRRRHYASGQRRASLLVVGLAMQRSRDQIGLQVGSGTSTSDWFIFSSNHCSLPIRSTSNTWGSNNLNDCANCFWHWKTKSQSASRSASTAGRITRWSCESKQNIFLLFIQLTIYLHNFHNLDLCDFLNRDKIIIKNCKQKHKSFNWWT